MNAFLEFLDRLHQNSPETPTAFKPVAILQAWMEADRVDHS